jgi:hypothetical protein
LGLFFSTKKPVEASNFFSSVSLFMVTLPIVVKPRFLRSPQAENQKGLFLSEDNGESWQRVDVEGPLKCGAQRISSLQYNKSLDGHLTVGTFPDAEFKAVGLGIPACKIPDQKGGGIYSVGEKKISWGIQSYPGFGFPSVLNHQKGFGGKGFFSTTRGAFKWHRSGLIHSWPNVPHDSFYSQVAVGKDAKGDRNILVSAPFSSADGNPISVWAKGKLAEGVSSPVPLNAGISGIAFDLSNPSQRLFVCNRHGILKFLEVLNHIWSLRAKPRTHDEPNNRQVTDRELDSA